MINKKIWAALGTAALLASAALPALAAEVGVSATVTPRLVSVSVSPGSVDYGVVDVPSIDNAPSPDSIIGATNDGNAAEQFNIKGANATGATKTWTIVDGAPGGAESFNYNHKFLDCADDATCGTPAAANNMTTGYETLEASVADGTTEYLKLRLSTPTETGGDTSEHSTTVTVQAVAI